MNEIIVATLAILASMNINVATLSFDDGPNPTYTPQILEILKDNDIKANFFLVGDNVNKYPNLVRQEIKEGHILGGHSMSHPELTKISLQRAKKEILDSMSLANTFQETDLFRFPYGSHNKSLDKIVTDNGYKAIFWNVDTTDWKYKNPDTICKKFIIRISHTKDGAIILMHDIHPQTVVALKEIVKYLKDNNIKTKTINELD